MTAPVQAVRPGTRETVWDAFYDGGWQPAADGERFWVHDPATGFELAEVAAAGQADVDAAVAAATRAFSGWRARSPLQRAMLLRQVAAVVREHVDEIGELLTRENGKPLRDALHIDAAAAHVVFDFFAGLAPTLDGHLIDQGTVESHVVLEPYGVVAAILPFNWPPAHFAGKAAPALAAGNTVILKPGDQAPLAVLRLVELANTVLPPGVLNALPGPYAGALLASHPGVSRISFTGSSATGRKVMAAAAEHLAVPTLELGGKNALIVLEDADVELALRTSLDAMFFNKGEACTSTSRILVHDSLHDVFVERFAEAASRFVVGSGLDPETDIGPVVDGHQRDRIMSYVEIGRQEGARVVAEGSLPTDEELAGGFWVAPTVFADVRPGMRIAQEEIFGPVACIMRFSDEDEAIEIANGTAYGLTAALFTVDLARARRLADRLQTGLVYINNYCRASMLGSPFGGVKDSGFGRESSQETLREYTRTKAVRVPGRGEPAIWPSVERVLG